MCCSPLSACDSQARADVAAGGVTDAGQSWADDFFLDGYTPCDTSTTPPSGVCPDSIFHPSAAPSAVKNVQLLAASRVGGVTTLVLRRPLAAHESETDVAITPDTASWIWAHGPLDLSSSSANADPALRLQQHGQSSNEYGTLTDFKLSACSPQCAPLPQSTEAPPTPVAAGFRGPVRLAGGGVSVQWKLLTVGGVPGVVLRFDSLRSCGWASVAVGSQMVGAHAYIAWQQQQQPQWRLDGYAMRSLDASGLSRTTPSQFSEQAQQQQQGAEKLMGDSGSGLPVVSGTGGLVSATFWRPFAGGGGAPALDPSAVPLLWALGSSWGDSLTNNNQHFDRSSVATVVNLLTGESAAGAVPPPSRALVAHAVLMVIAYAGLMPAAVASARYLRAGGVLPSPAWFRAHRAVAVSSVAVALAGVAASLAYQHKARGTVALLSSHSREGTAALVLLCGQPVNALLRPSPDPPGAPRWLTLRRGWEVAHRLTAAAAAAVAIAALFSGLDLSCLRGIRTCDDQKRGLTVWLALLAGYVAVREVAAVLLAPAETAPAAEWLPVGGRGKWMKGSPVPSDSSGSGSGLDVEGAPPAAAAAQEAGRRHASARRARFERVWAAVGAAWLAAALVLSILVAAGVIGGTGPVGVDTGAGSEAVSADRAAPPAAIPRPSQPAAAPRPPQSPPMLTCPLTPLGATQASRIGDGWCDASSPHNTAECGYDGGDCCNIDLPLFDCQNPASPHFGKSSAKGLQIAGSAISAPRNPRYSDAGRVESSYAFVSSFNNFYEARALAVICCVSSP